MLGVKWHLMKVVINRGRLEHARDLFGAWAEMGSSDDVQAGEIE